MNGIQGFFLPVPSQPPPLPTLTWAWTFCSQNFCSLLPSLPSGSSHMFLCLCLLLNNFLKPGTFDAWMDEWMNDFNHDQESKNICEGSFKYTWPKSQSCNARCWGLWRRKWSMRCGTCPQKAQLGEKAYSKCCESISCFIVLYTFRKRLQKNIFPHNSHPCYYQSFTLNKHPC